VSTWLARLSREVALAEMDVETVIDNKGLINQYIGGFSIITHSPQFSVSFFVK
jgi:hypothetical protein